MKNKGNKLLAVALLGLSVMLVGCGEDEKELTSEQKTAFSKVSGKYTVGVDKAGNTYKYTYHAGATTEAAITNLTAGGTDTELNIKVVVPTDGKTDLKGIGGIDAGTLKIDSGTLAYTTPATGATAGTLGIFPSSGTAFDVKATSYKLELDISISAKATADDDSVTIDGTLNYDSEGDALGTGCESTASETPQASQLKYGNEDSGVYVALASDGKLLVCK